MVGAGHGDGRVVGHVQTEQGIGTLVVIYGAANALNPSLRIDRDLDVPLLVAFLDRSEEMLAPILNPFYRPP